MIVTVESRQDRSARRSAHWIGTVSIAEANGGFGKGIDVGRSGDTVAFHTQTIGLMLIGYQEQYIL